MELCVVLIFSFLSLHHFWNDFVHFVQGHFDSSWLMPPQFHTFGSLTCSMPQSSETNMIPMEVNVANDQLRSPNSPFSPVTFKCPLEHIRLINARIQHDFHNIVRSRLTIFRYFSLPPGMKAPFSPHQAYKWRNPTKKPTWNLLNADFHTHSTPWPW